jgi:hypothetical protein
MVTGNFSDMFVSLAIDQTKRRHIFYNDKKGAATGYSLTIGISIPGRGLFFKCSKGCNPIRRVCEL